MEHSENTRVKIPALVHFTRLGYKYLSLKHEKENIYCFNNYIANGRSIFLRKTSGIKYRAK